MSKIIVFFENCWLHLTPYLKEINLNAKDVIHKEQRNSKISTTFIDGVLEKIAKTKIFRGGQSLETNNFIIKIFSFFTSRNHHYM